MENKAKHTPKEKTLLRDEDKEEEVVYITTIETVVDPDEPTADQMVVEIDTQRRKGASIHQAELTARMERPSNLTEEEERSPDDELPLSLILKPSAAKKPSTAAISQLSTKEVSKLVQRFTNWIQLGELIEKLQAREIS